MQSPFHEIWAGMGAAFAPVGGIELPRQFRGFRTEYDALATGAAAADRSYRGRLRVTGKDRASFLQNMLTNDVKAIATGAGVPAAFLTRQGKLVTDLVVFRLDDSYVLEMERERLGATRESLSRYVVSEDVTLEDDSDFAVAFSVDGPEAAEALSRSLDEALPALAPYHWVFRRISGTRVRVAFVPHGPCPSFDVQVAETVAPRALAEVLQAGGSVGIVPAGFLALETRRVEAGIPQFGVDMDESHLPLEARLDAGISFNKGCYIGQEYVARLAHRGHVNRKLVGLSIAGEKVPEPKSPVSGAGAAVGHVTSSAFSPSLGCAIALGYVHRDFMEPGSEVSIESGGTPSPARVSALPFLS